jgi:hypothetical protein
MFHSAIPVPKQASDAQKKAPCAPKFSAELMKMLAQLVMLR